MINKRGIITTILVVQLIFLAIITMSTLQTDKENFSQSTQFKKIAAQRLTSLFNDIEIDVLDLKTINASNETLNSYIFFVNSSKQYYSVEMDINTTHLAIYDRGLEISKEGTI